MIVPPYDVIAADERSPFFERDPHNAIRFELTRDVADESTTDYSEIAETLRAWRASGILVQDSSPGYYVLKQRFTAPGGEVLERIGFYGELGLEEYENRVVLPHERTLAGPKADRLKVLRAAEANLSAVFLLYEDREDVLASCLESAFASSSDSVGRARDDAGVDYELARLVDPGAVQAVQGFLADRPCVIADGHHRYETALEYRRERLRAGADPSGVAPFDSTLAYMANVYAPGSLLLPIHRVNSPGASSGRPGPGPISCRAGVRARWRPQGMLGRSRPWPVRPSRSWRAGRPSSRMPGTGISGYLPGTRPWAMGSWFESWKKRSSARSSGSPSKISANGEVSFPKSAERAARDVREGAGTVALYLNALTPEDVFRVTGAGELMPQKSTFFYPKIPTGMVFRLHASTP